MCWHRASKSRGHEGAYSAASFQAVRRKQTKARRACQQTSKPARTFKLNDLAFVIKSSQMTGKMDSGMRGPYKVTAVLPYGRYELHLLSGSYGKSTQASAEYMVPWRGEWTPDVCATFFEGELTHYLFHSLFCLVDLPTMCASAIDDTQTVCAYVVCVPVRELCVPLLMMICELCVPMSCVIQYKYAICVCLYWWWYANCVCLCHVCSSMLTVRASTDDDMLTARTYSFNLLLALILITSKMLYAAWDCCCTYIRRQFRYEAYCF